jgi:hypothetical protein
MGDGMKVSAGCVMGALLSISGAASAQAAPDQDLADRKVALANCLKQSVDGADKKSLVQWIFVMMANHPDVAAFASIDADKAGKISQEGAKLFERLIAIDCAEPVRGAIKAGGTGAISDSFGMLGEAAMDGLMKEPKVEAAIAASMENIDEEKMVKALVGP